jgi:hypothetical protein
MIRSAAEYHFAVLAIVCTLAIFLFPLVSGPYPVTHGPAADFETVRALHLVLVFIALAAFSTLSAHRRYPALIGLRSIKLWPPFVEFSPTTRACILRC